MRHRIQRLTNWLYHLKGRHRRTPTPPVNTPQAPRRVRLTIDGDAAAPMVRPYVLLLAEAQRAGAASW
jgi:hypothetical protein